MTPNTMKTMACLYFKNLSKLLYEKNNSLLRRELRGVSINSYNTVSFQENWTTILRPQSDERVDGAHDQLGRHVILISN